MSSNLACVGLGVTDNEALDALVGRIRPHAVHLGEVEGVEVLRWEDPSGARLILGFQQGELVDLLPSFASQPGAILSNVKPANWEVALAEVVDDNGEMATMTAVELEQRIFLPRHAPAKGPAAIVALGQSVEIHASDEAFAGSRDSLINPEADIDEEPPPEVAERGIQWPPRWGPKSFVSYGVFADPNTAEATAWLAGEVLTSDRRVVVETGQEFYVARVQTAGFDADVCLAASDHAAMPLPGEIVAGTVFLVASMETLEGTPPKRRLFGRR